MTATVSTVCPKCGYARTAAETVPAWQCPSCGIAYVKFRPKANESRQAGAAAAVPPPADNRTAGPMWQSGLRMNRGMYAAVAYVILLGAGTLSVVLDSPIWLWVLPLMSAAAFLMWLESYRVKSQILNVPTSRVSSAVQGYVELHGKVEYVPGCTLKGALTNAPCVWYAYIIIEGSGKRARTVERGDFGTPFLLRDGTGDCLVDPNAAHMLGDRHDKWVKGDRTYAEWSIRVGDPIYVIGRFSSDALHADGGLGKETMVKLRAWLRDPKAFFKRFDANRDGRIAPEELAEARNAAQREAAQYYSAQGGMHTMTDPGDGRPFIVANTAHDSVAAHFGTMSAGSLSLFFITLGFTAYAWNLF